MGSLSDRGPVRMRAVPSAGNRLTAIRISCISTKRYTCDRRLQRHGKDLPSISSAPADLSDGLWRSGRISPAGSRCARAAIPARSEEHTSELQSRENLVCRLLLEKKK